MKLNEGKNVNQEEEKIVLPKEVQMRMMKFFLRTSIPRKKQLELEKSSLSNTDDRSDT